MDQLEEKKVTTARGFEYSYYASPQAADATAAARPVLLFLHGFPDDASLWHEVIAGLRSAEDKAAPLAGPFRIIAPDMLGYRGTSKPTDPAQYDWKLMSDDIADILDAEKAEKAIVIGHDWGSMATQRFYLHFPARVAGLVLLSVAYIAPDVRPGAPVPGLDALNKHSEAIFGYPSFAYWAFFTAPDAPRLIHDNLERFYESLHGDEPDWMRNIFCTHGAYREFLGGTHPRSGKVALKPYAQKPEWRDRFLERFGAAEDSLAAPVQYYVAAVKGVSAASAQTIPAERLRINVPVLYIGSTGDAVCRHELIEAPRSKGLLPDLESHVLEAGHWMPMEVPDQIVPHLWGFLEKRFM